MKTSESLLTQNLRRALGVTAALSLVAIAPASAQESEEQAQDVEKLLEKLEEDDDVQNVYHTMEETTA